MGALCPRCGLAGALCDVHSCCVAILSSVLCASVCQCMWHSGCSGRGCGSLLTCYPEQHSLSACMGGCRAAEVFPTEQFKTMRARCISQELSWKAPAKKWCVHTSLCALPSVLTALSPPCCSRVSFLCILCSLPTLLSACQPQQ